VPRKEVAAMAMQMIREKNRDETRDRATRPRLRLVRGGKSTTPQPRVVAQVLSDGTIREMDGTKAWDTRSSGGWRQGSVAGDGWTLWWEHRPWTGKTA
jgi:hypothetical protein